ncbi:MAG TPA: hypothetical protein VFS00_18955, partial [Polyangiaceae bacterium]|nr:hypothetical protein [Polyangiaceae bacterium]
GPDAASWCGAPAGGQPHFFEFAVSVAGTGGRGAGYGGVDARYSIVQPLGSSSSGGHDVRDTLLGSALGLGLRGRFGTGWKGSELASIGHVGLAPLAFNRQGSVRVPSLLGLAMPEPGLRFSSFGAPRGYLAFHAPFVFILERYVGLEIDPSVYYLPADGAFDFGFQIGGLFQ